MSRVCCQTLSELGTNAPIVFSHRPYSSVTGGARGLGVSFAQGLAEAGLMWLYLMSLSLLQSSVIFPKVMAWRPHHISEGLNIRFEIYLTTSRVDVTSMENLEKGFEVFAADFGGILDICVPCAGINKNIPFLETSFEEHQRLISVNVTGVFPAQLAAKQMIKNGTIKGSIIMTASIASYMAIRTQTWSAYCGTKGVVKAMAPPIAAALNQYGIRVNTISPGFVRTEMTAPVRSSLQINNSGQ